MPSPIQINERINIPQNELSFTFSCSSGPGGQHVNKVNTRVTLLFDISGSKTLSFQQKELLEEKLSSRINKQGVLRVVSYKHRSQYANKMAVLEKFCALVRFALSKRKSRTKTTVPKRQKVKRLKDKKFHSRLKKTRGKADENF